jgi:16S rRNA G966 N2-methylase RsmD
MTDTKGHLPAEPSRGRVYNRAYLLSPEKRNQVMELWEVQQYGRDSYGDADYVHLYGMPPDEWYRRGIRLLARTTVECVRDALGDAMGQDVAHTLQGAPEVAGVTVLDPFAGSCNSLYWLLNHIPDAKGIAFEQDPIIFEMTSVNIAALDLEHPIELVLGDFRQLLPTCTIPTDHLVAVFVAPPWGDALDAVTGLDLRRTHPPVAALVNEIDRVVHDRPVLYVTQVFEHLEPMSFNELEAQFEWTNLRIYDLNVAGMNHGLLLGSRRWRPLER